MHSTAQRRSTAGKCVANEWRSFSPNFPNDRSYTHTNVASVLHLLILAIYDHCLNQSWTVTLPHRQVYTIRSWSLYHHLVRPSSLLRCLAGVKNLQLFEPHFCVPNWEPFDSYLPTDRIPYFGRLPKSLTAIKMARRAYGANQDMDPYRRSGRSAIQVQSHPRPYAPANHSQPPPHEPPEDGADNSPRRRIALAVRVFLWSYMCK